MMHRTLRSLAGTALAFVSACAGDLPQIDLVISTRPLAYRITVDAPADPDLGERTEALPFETIEVESFIVDAQGRLDDERIIEELNPVWLACPLQPLEGVFGCLRRQLPTDLDEIDECPRIDLTDVSAGPPASVVPCRIVEGTGARPRLQVPPDPAFLLGGDLELTVIAHRPGEGTTRACAQALLQEDDALPDGCLFTSMRTEVGPDTQIRQLAEMFGIPPDASLPPVPEVPADPDRHPGIVTFRVTVASGDTVLPTIDVARGDTITASLGQTLHIETTAPESDLQVYPIPLDATSFAEDVEAFEGAWYRTWGELLSPVSDDPLSINEWTLTRGQQDTTERPVDDTAWLFYVLRDGRQGVDFWWMRVQLTP